MVQPPEPGKAVDEPRSEQEPAHATDAKAKAKTLSDKKLKEGDKQSNLQAPSTPGNNLLDLPGEAEPEPSDSQSINSEYQMISDVFDYNEVAEQDDFGIKIYKYATYKG